MAVLQSHIPYDPLSLRPLPGIQPLDPAKWLIADEAFTGQLAERERLLSSCRDQVLALVPEALPAARELLDTVVQTLADRDGHHIIGKDGIARADGVRVPLDRDDPMDTLGRLVQEDLCILEKRGDEHVLTGAVLCFPASWTLDEKFLRPLTGIHVPVPTYDASIAARVQRLFDGVQPGRPLWRFNALWYAHADLHQPRRAGERRPEIPGNRTGGKGGFLRSERQCILRLPQTRAVVFSIHTYVVDGASLSSNGAAT